MTSHQSGAEDSHAAKGPTADPSVPGVRHPGMVGNHLPDERGRSAAGAGRRTTAGFLEPQGRTVRAGDGGHGQEVQGVRLRQLRDAGSGKRQQTRRRCPPLLRQHHQATAGRPGAHPERAGLLGRSDYRAGRPKSRRQSGLRPTQPGRQPGHDAGGTVDQSRPRHRRPDARAQGGHDVCNRSFGAGVGHAPQRRQHAGQDHHGDDAGDFHHAAAGLPVRANRGRPPAHGLRRIDRGQRDSRVSRLSPADRAFDVRRQPVGVAGNCGGYRLRDLLLRPVSGGAPARRDS